MAATTQGRLINYLNIGHNVDELARVLAGVQLGTAVLVAGTCTVTSQVDIESDAQCYPSLAATGGTVSATWQYACLPANHSTGDGTVLLQACLTTGAVNTADCSTLNFFLFPRGLTT